LKEEIANLTTWRDRLVAWRKTLCDQLLDCPPRSPQIALLKLSIIRIDRDLDFTVHMPLDDLMAAEGATWLGCLPDVEQRLKALRDQVTATS